MKTWKKILEWLDGHRAIWELALAIIGVAIMVRQTRILEMQTSIQERQQVHAETQIRLSRRTDLISLRNSIWAIFDLFPGEGIAKLGKLPREARPKFVGRVRELLDKEEPNAVLQENPNCLKRWRNAITHTKQWDEKSIKMPHNKWADEFYLKSMGRILSDVSRVWGAVILRGEIDVLGGGRPKDYKSPDINALCEKGA